MSQPVGLQYKSRIPTLSDDADISEALKVYHYGVDNYSSQPIPDDSIEGNFRSLNVAVESIEDQLSSLSYVKLVSETASPNVVTAEGITTTPLALRAIASQTSPLLSFQNSSSVSVGSMGTGGNLNIAGYITVGSTTQSTTTGVNVVVGNASHKGIVVKAQASQTANIQEWQNSSGTPISWVNKDGKIFSNSIETATLTATQVLTNKTIDGSLNTFSNIPLSAIPTIGDEYAAKHIDITNVSGLSEYTLDIDDDGAMVEMYSASPNTLIVPAEVTTVFPIGTAIVITQTGTGQTTIEGQIVPNPGGVIGEAIVNGTPGLKLRTQWSSATLIKRGPDEWIAIGDLVA